MKNMNLSFTGEYEYSLDKKNRLERNTSQLKASSPVTDIKFKQTKINETKRKKGTANNIKEQNTK